MKYVLDADEAYPVYTPKPLAHYTLWQAEFGVFDFTPTELRLFKARDRADEKCAALCRAKLAEWESLTSAERRERIKAAKEGAK